MNKEIWKKTGIISVSLIAGIYAIFLILPIFLSGIANSCGHYLTKVIDDSTGFKVKFENVRVVTTPKLTVGAKVGHLSAALPNGDEFLSMHNAQVKLSLLPFLIKKVEIDMFGADDISTLLKIRNDGKFLIEEYIPESTNNESIEAAAPITGLPMGLKLSDHLPDIRIKNYKIEFNDMHTDKNYSVSGQDLNVTDFIINKKIKISTNGKIVLEDRTPFNYDVKVVNKIMPDVTFNDLVFAPGKDVQEENSQPTAINIIDIFKTVYKNRLTADIKTDLTTEGTIENINLHGLINIRKLSLAVDGKPLPDGHVLINMKGKTIDIDSSVYTSADEETSLTGKIKTGKKPLIDLTCKSNANINNIFNVIDSIAKSVNYRDLDTLTAKGSIDADFTIKADTKKVESSGYFRIPSASISYAMYNVLIDKITANIDFSDNMVNIKKLGFVILGQPLDAYGTIKPDTTSDLHLTADKLPVKGILTAAGQVGLLKENDIKSGVISMDASITGKLKTALPVVNINAENINILNKPSKTTIKVSDGKINLSSDGKKYKGSADVNSISIINPSATIALPKAAITLDEKDVTIDDTYLTFDNSRIDISGKISDYTTKKLSIDITAKGALMASDLRSAIPADLRNDIKAVGKLPLFFKITGNDKTQNITAQILATPSNYLHITSVDQLNNKSTLISSNMKISNDTLKLYDTGVFAVSGLSSLPATALSGNIVSVSGSVDKLSSKQLLNGINIKTPSQIGFSIPGFKNSKVTASASVTLNGNAMNATLGGNINIPSISIPTIKTDVKNVTVDLGSKAITVNTPSINVDNSVMNAKTVISPNFTKGIIINNMDFHAVLLDSDTMIKAMEGMPAQTNSANAGTHPASTQKQQDLGVIIQSGKGSINKFKSGGIIAENLSSNYSLANNTLYLKGIQGNSFGGKVNGDVSVNLISGNSNVDFHGNSLNASKAIEGAAGLKNALSGELEFNAKVSLNGYAPSENEMMKSLKGTVDFDIKNGTFGNIGRLENLLVAQNLMSNGIIAAAMTPITNMPVVKNSANFKSVTGDMTFDNGWADIKSIKTSGPSMSSFVYGKYNLLNASANVTILGRLGADVVAALGPVGELSVSKLTSYIPKLGTMTGNLINALTTNPKGERISEIPALSDGSTDYSEFKVSFNGGVESKSSVKSFKWLSVCDTSEIEDGSFKDQLKQSTDALKQLQTQRKEEVQKNVEDAKNAAKQTAEDFKNQVQNTKDSLNELKNLFKKPAETTETVDTTVPATE